MGFSSGSVNMAPKAKAPAAPAADNKAPKKDKAAVPKVKKTAIKKATKQATRVTKGTNGTRRRKIRTSVQFRRPHTLRLPRNPKYPRRSVPRKSKLDAFSVVKYPLTTESAMRKITHWCLLLIAWLTNIKSRHLSKSFMKLMQPV